MLPAARTLPAFFLASILLEPNRWQRARCAATRLAPWLDAIRSAGFEGIELWEKHWYDATQIDREALRASGLRFILNTYARLSPEALAERQRAAAVAKALRAEGMKFNLGSSLAAFPREIEAVRAWADDLPDSCRLLCECHADTAAETPEMAALVAAATTPGRVGFILHPFFTPQPSRWLTALGPRIVHWHVQARAADNIHRFVALADRPEWIVERLAELAPGPVPPTATIEFTRGVAEPDERIEDLLRHAAADRSLLLRQLSP